MIAFLLGVLLGILIAAGVVVLLLRAAEKVIFPR